MIINYHKKIGYTMNDIIDEIKQLYHVKKVTYAGRLDPLAYGSVIILTDDDIDKRDSYMKKDKIYEFKIVNGIQTDTFDILGLITNNHQTIINEIKLGLQIMEYPPYSSVPIKEYNKPYWYCALNNLPIINKPSKEINIYELIKLDEIKYNKNELLEIIDEKISTIKKQTFRQKEIIEKWNNLLMDDEYNISSYRVKLSSGGYVRYIADKLGGCAYDIYRKEYII
jgi:tRNA U55 pseudouridine synthase TruB